MQINTQPKACTCFVPATLMRPRGPSAVSLCHHTLLCIHQPIPAYPILFVHAWGWCIQWAWKGLFWCGRKTYLKIGDCKITRCTYHSRTRCNFWSACNCNTAQIMSVLTGPPPIRRIHCTDTVICCVMTRHAVNYASNTCQHQFIGSKCLMQGGT